jgi:hypothetical protein
VFLYLTPELPDDTPIDHVRFAVRIRKVLNAAGINTVGEVRKTSDKALLGLQDSWTELCHTSSRNAGPRRREAPWAKAGLNRPAPPGRRGAGARLRIELAGRSTGCRDDALGRTACRFDPSKRLEERIQEMIASGEAKPGDGFSRRLIVSP